MLGKASLVAQRDTVATRRTNEIHENVMGTGTTGQFYVRSRKPFVWICRSSRHRDIGTAVFFIFLFLFSLSASDGRPVKENRKTVIFLSNSNTLQILILRVHQSRSFTYDT